MDWQTHAAGVHSRGRYDAASAAAVVDAGLLGVGLRQVLEQQQRRTQGAAQEDAGETAQRLSFKRPERQ